MHLDHGFTWFTPDDMSHNDITSSWCDILISGHRVLESLKKRIQIMYENNNNSFKASHSESNFLLFTKIVTIWLKLSY